MTAALLTLLLLSPLFAGFLWLVYRQWRDHGLAPPGPQQAAALVVLLGLYAAMALPDWADPWTAWLNTLPSPAAHRILPAVWAVYSLPLWAATLVCCPQAARDGGAWLSPRLGAVSLRGYRMVGWGLLGCSVVVFGVLVGAGH